MQCHSENIDDSSETLELSIELSVLSFRRESFSLRTVSGCIWTKIRKCFLSKKMKYLKKKATWHIRRAGQSLLYNFISIELAENTLQMHSSVGWVCLWFLLPGRFSQNFRVSCSNNANLKSNLSPKKVEKEFFLNPQHGF